MIINHILGNRQWPLESPPLGTLVQDHSIYVGLNLSPTHREISIIRSANWLAGGPATLPEHQLLDLEAHQVAQLQRVCSCGEDEITVSAIHDNEIALDVEARSPQLSDGALKRVPRQAASIGDRGLTRSLRSFATVISASALHVASR